MRHEEVEISECEVVRRALMQRRELTAEERAHAERCAVCADALMETEIEAALEEKPEVAVPAEFAARVAVRARQEKNVRRRVRLGPRKRGARRHVGLDVAGGVALGRVGEEAGGGALTGLTPGAPVEFFIGVRDAVDTEVERHPLNRPIELSVPDLAFEARNWTA